MRLENVNRERMRMFIAALRSGEYNQAFGRLIRREGDHIGYCCLGVACMVALKEDPRLPIRLARDGQFTFTSTDDEEMIYDSVLPEVVADFYGIGANPTLVNLDNPERYITALDANDNLRWDFNEIADAFERAYLG